MSEEKFNDFLDGELDQESLDANTKKDLEIYFEVLKVFRARYDYKPSPKLEEKIMRRLIKPRKILWELALGVAMFATVFYVIFNVIPKQNIKPITEENRVVSELFDYLSLVKLVGDGF
ncbi:hypothetical protein [Pseudothermotoga sp.]|nr:hypothetical protein [Pseudothermotoga sp.]MCX7813279.1 hypothetical protein [Pseudothermotoga sp.]MDW8140384.1 hypothetical protein [Pseudothermotoga sp.]